MTYVVEFFPTHVEGVIEVEHTKDNSWYRKNPEEINGLPGLEKYGGKNNCRDSP